MIKYILIDVCTYVCIYSCMETKERKVSEVEVEVEVEVEEVEEEDERRIEGIRTEK